MITPHLYVGRIYFYSLSSRKNEFSFGQLQGAFCKNIDIAIGIFPSRQWFYGVPNLLFTVRFHSCFPMPVPFLELRRQFINNIYRKVKGVMVLKMKYHLILISVAPAISCYSFCAKGSSLSKDQKTIHQHGCPKQH